MSKPPSFTPQKIIRILKKRGFKLDRTKGSHQIYYHKTLKKRVVVPFHKKDLPKGTFLEILKQAGIDRQKLKGAIWGKRNVVAEAIGIHPVSLSRKVHGQQPLKIDELNKIAKYLEQNTMEFLIEVEMDENNAE